ncbi:glycosyltransferase family 10 domain-containing protein [Alicyclobacillus sp. ALC3]|uniref:glycosyltransferase family 10 domain-containing protein n=1 Tax=Alicyclobacillus sp. ALC3 TaxID=2796143 RepID=UPI002378AFBC|nr:glycosyltransferase family 10 [Alicyclobacillus sp. ALC3]WDL95353.1 hypothetical protein JC200_13115 [Alicyclobacillus sp. ALC3]
MNVAFYSIWVGENKLFFQPNRTDFGEDLFAGLRALQAYGNTIGWRFDQAQRFQAEEIDVFVFHEVPATGDPVYTYARQHNKPMILWNYEPPVVYPSSHQMSNHDAFVKVFTEFDQMVDGHKYIKFNSFCYDFSVPMLRRKERASLCVMMNGHKYFTHPQQLYSERVNTLLWFNTHHPDDLHLYGRGWEKVGIKNYKGIAHGKKQVLSNYKFSICYENAKGMPGYLTEKIFDSFFAGCVPVYWGDSHVTDTIPPECFIDRGHFNTHEELYAYLTQMSDAQYNGYLDAIEAFLQRSATERSPFSLDSFVQTMSRGIADAVAEFATAKPGPLVSPTSGQHLYLAKESQQAKRYAQAVGHLQAALADPALPWRQEAELLLTQVLMEANDVAAARAHATLLTERYPHLVDPAYLSARADVSVAVQMLRGAIQSLQQLVQQPHLQFSEVSGLDRWNLLAMLAESLQLAGLLPAARKAYADAYYACPPQLPAKEALLRRIAEIESQAREIAATPLVPPQPQ